MLRARIRRIPVAAQAIVFMTMFVASAGAVETHVTVSVLSKDAKFIGSSMGGALVTIRNADTGELLTSGLTEGSTGNTGLLIKNDITRRTTLVDDGSAKFQATVDIDAPTRVEISARGPMAQRQSIDAASVTQWLLPGKDVTAGNGVLLEIPGFVVDVLSPPTHQSIAGPADVTVRVNLTMM
jgi:predicted RecA/RadA family phage recombinase